MQDTTHFIQVGDVVAIERTGIWEVFWVWEDKEVNKHGEDKGDDGGVNIE